LGLVTFFSNVIWHPLDLLVSLTNQLGAGTYWVLFFLVFLESGMLIFSFIPGQSLLFMGGSIAASPHSVLNIWGLILMFTVAATAGSAVKYWTSVRWQSVQDRLIRRLPDQKVAEANAVFKKNQKETLIFGRFIPFVGLFLPVLAGSTDMGWRQFRLENLLGSLVWVVSCCAVGFFFGNSPFIRANFTWLFLAILVLPVAARQIWTVIRKKG